MSTDPPAVAIDSVQAVLHSPITVFAASAVELISVTFRVMAYSFFTYYESNCKQDIVRERIVRMFCMGVLWGADTAIPRLAMN